MGKFRFKRGLIFWLNGKEYVIKKRLSNNDFQVCNAITEELSSFSEEALVSFLFERKLSLEPPQTNTDFKRRDYKGADFSQIDDSLKEEARRREKYVKEYLSQGLQKRTEAVLKPVIEKVANETKDEHPPTWSTLYRWIKKYEGQRNDIRALITRNVGKGNRKSRLDVEVDQIINEVIDEFYLTIEKPNVQAAYSEITYRIAAENFRRSRIGLEQLRLPDRSTIYRRVDKLDPYEEAIKRYGRATADRMFHVSENARPYPTRPLEIVEIDHTKLPIFVIDPETNLPIGTPWLTTALDKFTVIPIGYYLSFEPPSSLSVMQCLLHAIKPKTYISKKYPSVSNTWDTFGLMEALRPDNGPEFYGKPLEDGCDQFDIDIDYTPPRSAWYKGSIERFFRMINTMLLQGQPGSFLKFLKVYDDEYDPRKKGSVSLDGLNEIVHIFIVDIVCQMSHPKFGSPRIDVWRAATLEFPPALPSDEKDLRVLLGAITQRVISEKGVEFEGLYYNSPELVRLRHIYEKRDKRRKTGTQDKEKAKVKYDPTDISCVYVFDPETDNFVAAPAVDQQYTQGLSYWQHQVIKRYAREEFKKVDIVTLSIAKKKIQEIVKREWKSTKQGRSKVSMARYLGVGRDSLDLSEVEAFVKEQASKDEKQQAQETALNFGSVQDSSDILAGVSDIGVTYNSSEVKQQGEDVEEVAQGDEAIGEDIQLDDDSNSESLPSLTSSMQQVAAEQKESEEPLQTAKKEKGGEKPKRKSSSKDSSNSKNDLKSARKEDNLDDWVPNVAGWSTNYDS